MPNAYNASPIYIAGGETNVIPAGGDNGPVWNGLYRIRFFDADGTVLKIDYAPAGKEIIAPDETPNMDPDYLVFYGWNYDIDNLSVEGPMDIGALYNTVDEKMYIWIDLNNGQYNGSVFDISSSLPIYARNGDIIDWGDGTTTTSTTDGYNYHKYSQYGKYLITITASDICRIDNRLFSSEQSHQGVLEKIYMPYGGYISVNYGAFQGCINLKICVLPCHYKTLVFDYLQTTFENCYSLKYITLPKYIGITGSSSFQKTYSLKNISFPIKTTRIAGFRNSGINSIIIPKNVKTLDSDVFWYSALNEVFFCGNQITKLNKYTFGDTKLTKIILPEGLTELPTTQLTGSAFYNIKFIETFVLPSTLTSLESTYYCLMLYNTCNNLILKSPTVITLTNPVQSGEYSYYTNIWVPDNLVDAYKADTKWSVLANKFRPLSQYTGPLQ